MKHSSLIYILTVLALFTSCRSDEFEEGNLLFDPGDAITLTVNTIEMEEGASASTRAFDNETTTTFTAGDVVGLSIMDKDGRLLANNVPYRYDGVKWDFDSLNAEGKKRVYYEKSMHTYLVYYPYDTSADGCKTNDDIRQLYCFRHRIDQTTDTAFRRSDPLACINADGPTRNINVKLAHLRNCFSLRPLVKWKIATGDSIKYQPIRETLEKFVIRDKNETPLAVYFAADSTYRYILPDRYEGKVTWRYNNRNHYFIGESSVSNPMTDPETFVGKRFGRQEVGEMGEFTFNDVKPLDLYCSKEIDGKVFGYIIPWDAVTLLDRDRFGTDAHTCIGVVIYHGHNMFDFSDYSDSGVGTKNCNGYIMALTSVLPPQYKSEPDKEGFCWQIADPNLDETIPINNAISWELLLYIDWSAYSFNENIRDFVAEKYDGDKSHFPALNACDTFGEKSGDEGDGGTSIMKAPSNTSGWYLPSLAMISYVDKQFLYGIPSSEAMEGFYVHKTLAYIRMHLSDETDYKKDIVYWNRNDIYNLFADSSVNPSDYSIVDGVWTCTEVRTISPTDKSIHAAAHKAVLYGQGTQENFLVHFGKQSDSFSVDDIKAQLNVRPFLSY